MNLEEIVSSDSPAHQALEQAKVSAKADRIAPWQFKKGQSGNPSGRPKGSKSLKEYAREMIMTMTDEERQDFLDGLDKRTVWEMAEGKPKQDMEVKAELTSKIIAVDE